MGELSAFAGCAPVAADHAGATASPVEPLSVVSVTAWRGQADALAAAVLAQCGLALPQAGHWVEHNGLTAVWAGPGHWWLQRAGRAKLLQELLPLGEHAGLIDISDGRAILRLRGLEARRILMSLLPLDLHPRVFTPGCVASTIGGHMTVQVRQIDDAPTYDLACLRSFAGSLWRSLELAGAGRLTLAHS